MIETSRSYLLLHCDEATLIPSMSTGSKGDLNLEQKIEETF